MTIELPDFSVDLHEAARRSESETREWVAEKLDESIERYRRFFALARSGERVAPTRDVDETRGAPAPRGHNLAGRARRRAAAHRPPRSGLRRVAVRGAGCARRGERRPSGGAHLRRRQSGASVYESLFVGSAGRGARR